MEGRVLRREKSVGKRLGGNLFSLPLQVSNLGSGQLPCPYFSFCGRLIWMAVLIWKCWFISGVFFIIYHHAGCSLHLPLYRWYFPGYSKYIVLLFLDIFSSKKLDFVRKLTAKLHFSLLVVFCFKGYSLKVWVIELQMYIMNISDLMVYNEQTGLY